MGRYRPPQPAASKYITPEGHQHLQGELDFLWKKRRPEVTRALSAAAAEGDRSENAEYIYRKKELREIDARVRHLRKRLDGMKVVDRIPDDQDRIFFGAWVRLVDESDTESIYRIVGPDEFDPKLGYISMDSPMGKMLLGKALDDEFRIRLPEGEAFYTIIDVSYSVIEP
ncbi:MAG: transcription elongation factor GreB [Gammaproteobacteria bacterium]|nr:transcription elongation factor GreB [Gammaproteobacteria bacterium]